MARFTGRGGNARREVSRYRIRIPCRGASALTLPGYCAAYPNARLRLLADFSPRPRAATAMEQTRYKAYSTTSSVCRCYRCSLLSRDFLRLILYLHHQIIEQRCEEVGEGSPASSFRISQVHHADQHAHHADQRVTPFPFIGGEADTGSVAINIIPKAQKPPSTRCQYHGIANIGLVSEPITLNRVAVAIMPIITPATMRRDATRQRDDRPADEDHQR